MTRPAGPSRRVFPRWGVAALPVGSVIGTLGGAVVGALLGDALIGAAIGAALGVGTGLILLAAAVVIASEHF